MKIKVDNYSITPSRFIAGTKGSYGFDFMDFEFGEDWEGLSKKIIFCPPNQIPVSVVLANEPIAIPMEVMSQRGKTSFALVGYENEKTKITVMGELDVLNTLSDNAENAGPAPTANELEQVLSHMQSCADNTARIYEALENKGFDANGWRIGTLVDGTGERISATVEFSKEGDLYLNTDTNAVYVCVEENVWSYIGSLKGEVGAAAGFGAPVASIELLEENVYPTVSVSASGENTSKVFSFAFGIPSSYALGGGGSRVKKYSVRFRDGKNEGVREDDATEMVAEVAVDSQIVRNDFDDVPFFNRRICNGIWSEGSKRWVITAYRGDEGFAWDGSNGEVLYECTPFYISEDTDINTYVSVCGEPCEGYYLAPMFSNATQKIYLPCFETYLYSKSGVYVPYSRVGYLPSAASYGSFVENLLKYSENAVPETIEIYFSELVLQLVEFATKDLQSVMRGVCDLPYEDSNCRITSMLSSYIVKIPSEFAAKMIVGQGVYLSTSATQPSSVPESMRITSIEDNGDGTATLGVDFALNSTAVGKYMYSSGATTGIAARAVTNASSGAYGSLSDGKSPCIWRGKENPWGNFKTVLHNCFVNCYADDDGVSRDHLNYMPSYSGVSSSELTASSVELDITLPSESGGVDILRSRKALPFLCVPEALGETCAAYYTKGSAEGIRSICVGGTYKSGDICGIAFDTGLGINVKNVDSGVRYYMLQR